MRRTAWLVVAHSSFELAELPDAEQAYAQVLALTPAATMSRAGLVENLAASIYKQGEQANAARRLPRGGRSLPAHQAGRADLEDPRGAPSTTPARR